MESKGGRRRKIDEEEDVEREGGREGGKGYSEGEGVGVKGDALATHKLGK